MNLITEKLSDTKKRFIDDYTSMFKVDKNKALEYIKTNNHFDFLTEQWYYHLSIEDLDGAYQVYDDDYYFTDLWNCFVTYSRPYLKNILKLDLYKSIKKSKVVVDLGCGVGLTTSMLTCIFPNAKVYGTNLKNTKQWNFCKKMSRKFDFKMIENVKQIKENVDVAFASEYFEHILSPIEHLDEIITNISPKYFIIANSFNTHSIGHFNEYIEKRKYIEKKKSLTPDDEIVIDQKNISRKFNNYLKSKNYSKIKTKLFNNKPNVWMRND